MYYQKYLLKTPQLDSNNTSDPNRKFNWLSKTKIEFGLMEEMYATLCTYICEEQTTYLGKYDQTMLE